VKAGSDDMVEVSFVVSGVVVGKHLPPFYSEMEYVIRSTCCVVSANFV
jgi:hypothetical protein